MLRNNKAAVESLVIENIYRNGSVRKAITAGGVGMAETFSVTPHIWEVSVLIMCLSSTFETGKEATEDTKGAKPKEWRLNYRGSWSDISTVLTFYDARKGSYEAFNWTPPSETTAISVRFKDNSLSISRQGESTFAECEVSLLEVL